MRISRRHDALLVGAALVLGCAMSAPRGTPGDADAQPCTISPMQLSRAPERTLYEVIERVCPSVVRAQREGREVRAYIILAGDASTPLGGATALRLLRPADIARVRFVPHASEEEPTVALVLLELRTP